MADRRRDTLLLLASRLDLVWAPSGLSRPAGLVPAVLEACPDCQGAGRVRDRFGRWSSCSRCRGRGQVAYDPMDAQHVPVGSVATVATARPRRTVRCDGCGGDGVHGSGRRCEVCGGAGRCDLHVFELRVDGRDQEERDALVAAIERRAQAGSYVELDRALELLRRRDRGGYRGLLAAVDAGETPLPDSVEAALVFVVARMPEPVRVPAEVRANGRERAEWRRRVKGRGVSAEALRRRDGEIRRALRQGVPTQRVAFEYGLSVATVYRIRGGSREAAA